MEATKLIRFYTITSELGNMIYTGSTEQLLDKRYSQHKSHLDTASKTIFETYGVENCKISEIFRKECCKNERDNIESEYIQQYKNNDEYNCVNIVIPTRTAEEYYIDNKEKIQKYKTQYYNDNKDKIKQYYNDNNEKIKQYKNKTCICSCGKEYTNSNKSQHEKRKFHINFTININISGTENTTNINIQELTEQIKTQIETAMQK